MSTENHSMWGKEILSQGLQFRANYTWSKNLDMNSGLTGAQAQNQAQMILNRNDLPRDWGPSALNITSLSSLSATWELPFHADGRWRGRLLLRKGAWMTVRWCESCHPRPL